jgi:hypothetical protein
LFFVFAELGLELRAFTLKASLIFVRGFFKIGSHELFARGWL